MRARRTNIFLKIVKILAWIIASFILLLAAIALVIQIPAVQLKLTRKAVTFLERRIGTKVALEGIRIGFPKNILLEGIYLEDQKGDTLLYAGKISVNTDLWALTRKEIQLNDVSLERSVAFVSRADNDSAFNFTYVIKAFAGDSTAVPDTLEEKGWDFSLKRIGLEKIRLKYDDRLTGNLISLSLGNFGLGLDEFDLKNKIVRAGEITLRDARADVKQWKLPQTGEPVQKTKADSSAALLFSLDKITLENVRLAYEQPALGQILIVDLGEVNVKSKNIDLVNQQIDLTSLSVKHTLVDYKVMASDSTSARIKQKDETKGADAETKPWAVSLGTLAFEDNTIQFNDAGKPRTRGTLDFNHLSVEDLNIYASDIRYSESLIQVRLGNLSLRENSGFAVRSFKGNIDINEKGVTLKDFILLTNNSRLQLEASAGFTSLKHIGDTYAGATISADIHESFINVRDILYFKPSLLDSVNLNLPADTRVLVDATVTGAVNNLRIDHLIIRTLSDTYLETSGTVAGLPDARHLKMNIALDQFHTTRSDMESILPDSLLPGSMQLPGWINVKGKYNGTPDKASFQTLLTSADGNIDLQGKMNLDSASSLRGVNATLRLEDLDIGNILGNPDTVMGKLTMRAEIQTAGLTLKEMNGTFSSVVERFDFQRYRYTDLKLSGTIRDRILSLAAGMADKNLDFALAGEYDLKQEVPKYHLTLDLKNSNFEALHLSKDPIRARGTLLVNLATRDFKVMNGNVGIRKVAVFNGDKLYAIDSLLFASIDQEGYSEINIDSDLLTADFEGSINIFGLPDVVRDYVNSYYHLDDTLNVNNQAPQHFRFGIRLKNTEMLTDLLIPDLTSFKPGEISGEFDSEQRKLDLRMDIEEMQYAGIGLKSFGFRTSSDSASLKYILTIDKIMVDSMKVDGLEFNGRVARDSIRTNLVILDSTGRDKYAFAGTIFNRDKGFELTLLPGGTLLNYQKWTLPPTNYMRFGGEKFIAHDVEFANRREKLIIESDSRPASPILIAFRELNLENLSSVIAKEKPLSGLLQGDINIFPDPSGMAFTSDLTIDELQISQVPWGNFSLKVDQKVRNQFDVDFGLLGNNNDLKVEGFYTAGETPAFDLTATVKSFNLQSLQPFIKDQLKDLAGNVTGEIKLKGTPERPDIDGDIVIADTHFISTYLNSPFSIDRESISFADEGISFDEFEVADNKNNKALLDGTILTKDYRDFQFNLDLSSDNFRLLNTTAKDNDLFYGKVDVKLNARIRGNMTTPAVTMQIGLSKGSNLTYVVPQSEASILEAEGIVEFVDKTFEHDPFMKKINKEIADTVKSAFRGIDLTARLELTDEETFTIVIDPLTGDQLSVKGNSTLTLQIDPTGDIHLTGRYEIAEGSYNLSFYKFVKRKFAIDKGSTITWLGDPMNAQMDIRAIYKVETSPIELFSNQLSGAAGTEVNLYKQLLPFLVYLKLNGELLQPEINFQLEMPMASRNAIGGSVYARLQDINTRESDLNKQVFALLILKRFIADDPFENQGPGGLESTARSSVSKILSEQLNRLGEKIKGVELSFDIKSYEDYSSGQGQGQTQLQLGVSKSLFNDRLVVKLSGNIDLEGRNSNRQATDYIGDLALEYKITPDGRLRITGFRNSDYDMIDGELLETGTGLIYVKDYNTLSELFKADAEKKN